MNAMECFLDKTYIQYPKQVNAVSIIHLVNVQIIYEVNMNRPIHV